MLIIYNNLDNKRISVQENNSFKMVHIKTKWDSKEIYLIMMKIEIRYQPKSKIQSKNPYDPI